MDSVLGIQSSLCIHNNLKKNLYYFSTAWMTM